MNTKVNQQRPKRFLEQSTENATKHATKRGTKKMTAELVKSNDVVTKKTEGDVKTPCYGCQIDHPSQVQHGCTMEPEKYKSTERNEELLRQFGDDAFMYSYSGSGF